MNTVSSFGKSQVSNRERIALAVATWFLAFTGIALVVVGISITYLDIHSHDVIYQENHFGIDPVVLYFHLSVVVSLLVAGLMVLFRRIGLALLVVFIPLGFFANFVVTFFNRWVWLVELGRRESYQDMGSGFLSNFFGTYVDIVDYVSLFTILHLIGWYVWILVRSSRSFGSRLS
jgi:hypothetical protein